MPVKRTPSARTKGVAAAAAKGSTATVNGLTFQARQPTETQLILIGRNAKRAEKAGNAEDYKAGLNAMVAALDIIDTLFIDDGERAQAEELMASGKLSAGELLDAILQAFKDDLASAAPKPPVARVTRGKAR